MTGRSLAGCATRCILGRLSILLHAYKATEGHGRVLHHWRVPSFTLLLPPLLLFISHFFSFLAFFFPIMVSATYVYRAVVLGKY